VIHGNPGARFTQHLFRDSGIQNPAIRMSDVGMNRRVFIAVDPDAPIFMPVDDRHGLKIEKNSHYVSRAFVSPPVALLQRQKPDRHGHAGRDAKVAATLLTLSLWERVG
jgi:hypothetical protein